MVKRLLSISALLSLAALLAHGAITPYYTVCFLRTVSTGPTAPTLAPTLISATYDEGCPPSEVHLVWTASGQTYGGMRTHVFRSINGGAFSDIADVAPTAEEYFDMSVATLTALALAQEVRYKLQNQNDVGNGPFSSIQIASPP